MGQPLRYQVKKIRKIKLGPETLPFYHVELEPEGYLVINSDDDLAPVIAMSTIGTLDLRKRHDNALYALLERDLIAATNELKRVRIKGVRPPHFKKNKKLWDRLSPDAEAASSQPDEELVYADVAVTNTQPEGDLLYYTPTNAIAVDILVSTRWNQWNHYNDLCPEDGSVGAYDGRVPVGCVAVVGAQIMRYYAWPPFGQGSHSYTDSSGSITGYHSVVFSDTYDWTNMQNSYTWNVAEPAVAVDAVAEIMYEVGVAVNMGYESDGSSASPSTLNSQMNNHFFYDKGTYYSRSVDEATFDSLLRQELLSNRPVMATIPGHAIIVDGYVDEVGGYYYHINYGWGGVNDDWYLLTGIPGGGLQSGIMGTQPQSEPLWSPDIAATNMTGNFDLDWFYPSNRLGSVTAFRVDEGTYGSATNTVDDCSDTAAWTMGSWTSSVPGSDSLGSCFWMESGSYGTHAMVSREEFRIKTGTTLSFDYEVHLYDDSFLVQISPDNGNTWSNLFSIMSPQSYPGSWTRESISLSAYAGNDCKIRFTYYLPSGSYYPNEGIWVDEIVVSNAAVRTWVALSTNVSFDATSFSVSGRASGDYCYRIAAHDGTAWQESSSDVMVTVLSGTPAWWRTRSVVVGANTNDYAAANQGQVKWMAQQAYLEMEDVLAGSGGAGATITALVGSFTSENNYQAVNAGQLKAVAKPFYQRLGASYPWSATTADDIDYAAVNIGQVKQVFNFHITP